MKRKGKGYCVFFFGAKKMKGFSRRAISLALTKVTGSERGNDLNYVVMGNVRETEKTAYSICRNCHLPVVLIPADFEKFSVSAEHLRNGLALKFFKPTVILMAHTDPEEESVAKSVLTWAKNHSAQVIYIGKKAEEKK